MSETVTIRASGHEHVLGEHSSTLELTSEDFLTPAGDCILGIGADTVPAEFEDAFVTACQDSGARIEIELEADGHREVVVAKGDEDLTFDSDRSAVVRTSEYIDDRTIAVGADGAAADVDRELVAALANGADLTATITVD